MARRRSGPHFKVQTSVLVIFALLKLIFTTDIPPEDQTHREALFYSMRTTSIIGNVTSIELVKNELECAFMCLRNYPRSCLSFNFGGNLSNEMRICELSNSERALEPHRMQSRIGFDYFGVEKVYLSRYFPCLSFPCRNGGSCVNGPVLEMFSCNCPLEIRVLPYIDNTCNGNYDLVKTGIPVKNVFYASVGIKQLNYFEAGRLCEMYGANLASLNELQAAYEAGLYRCQHAWLIDATVRYPMQEVRPTCGNMIGIVGNANKRDKNTGKYDAWCHKR